MSPVNFGEMSKYMGPLTSGGMMSEQQRMAVGESMVNQNKGLDDILTAQQTRDINSQKLPGELEMQRANIDAKKFETKEKESKLNREQYGYFLEDVIRFTPTDDPMADAFRLEETAKKAGLDPQDARVRFALTQAGNKEQLAALQKALTFNDPKHQQKLAEQAAQDAAAMSRTKEEVAGRIKTTGMTNATQIEVANIRKQQAIEKAKAAGGRADQLAKAKDWENAAVAYSIAAASAAEAGEMEAAQRLTALAQNAQTKHQEGLILQNQARNAGTPTFIPGQGMGTRPMPQPTPVQVPPAGPSVAPMPGVPMPTAPQPQAQQAPVKVSSDAEYLALPKGTVYISPDGKQRTKQ